ncbi:hypothetical protein M8J76_005855 [Diaphorina citri]|nr:hypothetical protein M8J76_005855 [Diaphorina citri]KAI5754793.1 hypothetical protein M8J77_011520 [Diaphorina citri]
MVKKNGQVLTNGSAKNTILFPNPVFGNLVISRQNQAVYKLSSCPATNVTQSFQNEKNIKPKLPSTRITVTERKDNKDIVRKLEKIANTVQKNEALKANVKDEKAKKALEKHSIECFNSNFNAILYEIIRAKAEERLIKKVDEQKSDGSRYELYEIDLDGSHLKETNTDDSRYPDDRSVSSGTIRRGEATPRSQCSTQSFEWNYETVEYESGHGNQHRKVSELVDKLLYEIYGNNDTNVDIRRRSSEYLTRSSRTSGNDTDSSGNVFGENYEYRKSILASKSNNELRVLLGSLKNEIHQEGNRLVRQLKRRETLIARQEADSNMVTALLQAHSEKRSKYKL